MTPRRSVAPATFKRERSTSSSLSPAPIVKPSKSPRISKSKTENGENIAPKKPRVSKVKQDDGDGEVKPKKVAKSKAWPPPELDPATFPPRSGYPPFVPSELSVPPNGGVGAPSTTPRPLFLGAHTSSAGGPATALYRAAKAGANGLALFVKSQRQWKSNPYEQEAIDRFHAASKGAEQGGLGYAPETILVHGSYLINLGNPDKAKWETSYQCFVDDLHRCHQLGIKLYNWHPGSTVGACTKEESYASIAKAINAAHKQVPEVITVIENMANAKSNIIGTTFHDLASIIALVEDKSRVRVCLDTCHLFAAGYDLRTPEAYKETMGKFNAEVGNGYLAGMHLNDSKTDLGSCKDLHENIGLELMRDPLMAGIPLVLETPASSGNPLEAGELSLWTKEIALLYEIQGVPDEEWEMKKVEIEKKWRAERDTLNPPKEKKAKKAPAPAGKKGKKKKDDDDEGCESHDEED